jgi:hypothetical protein
MLRRVALLLAALAYLSPVAAQEPSEDANFDFVPDANGEQFRTSGETAPDMELVARIFAVSFADTCSWGTPSDPESRMTKTYELSFRYSFDDPEAAEHPMMLYRFFCDAGAYNERHVYMLWDGDNGLRPVSFAEPTYRTELADPENPDSAITAMKLTGFVADRSLTNSTFDPETRQITSNACFRGMCDASTVGVWVLDGPEFRLDNFQVDPSYDGKVNLIELVDYAEPMDVPLTPASGS